MTPYDQVQYPPRYCSRKCAGIAHRGDGHPSWRGGRTVQEQGYVLVYMPAHPAAGNDGYVPEHRLVMEGVLGRLLDPAEVVHHENDSRCDNRPENLRLFANQAAHKRYENASRRRDEAGRYLPRRCA